MTRKEIIKYLNIIKAFFLGSEHQPISDAYFALDEAIKALEQEPTYYPPCIDCHKKMDEIRCAYDKLKEQEPKTGEWIDVKDRKPERTAWIICTDGINISVEKYKKDGIDHFFPRGRWFDTEDMVAWQPLPQPYKAESE